MPRSKKTTYLPLLAAALSAIPAAQPAWAGVGVQVGARGGLDFDESDDLFVGGEMRLSFPLSPLTINPAFDYYFIEGQTFYQISVNALYDLPISALLVKPYVGPGVCLNIFSFDPLGPDVEPVPGYDENGSRLGLNLIGGVRFDLPLLRPFFQGTVSIGEIDLIMVSGGVLIDILGG